jgi:hypothetical protein
LRYRTGDTSIRDLFQRAGPEFDDPHFLELVDQRLEGEPELVTAWQQYSHDKRGTPSPYLDGLEVGFVEVIDGHAEARGVHSFETSHEACASFVFREALWVLQRREIP